MILSDYEQAILSGAIGSLGDNMAMNIVVGAAQMLGATRLIEVVSSHIDGCLYHGDSGVLFCEELVRRGAKVKVPSTTNVSALNLLKGNQARLPPKKLEMAQRLMDAHDKIGCIPSWTCAPYQAGARPRQGDQIAWGESNAVAFANTVLGARTNRYGDFLDIACAISGRAPYYGLHCPENRFADLLIDVSNLPQNLLIEDTFFPVLGAIIGRAAGESICVVEGLKKGVNEDQLKSLCAGAASTGAVGLIHISGVTPEAPSTQVALDGNPPKQTINVKMDMIKDAIRKLSLADDGPIDCVALGSPHFSTEESRKLLLLTNNTKFKVPVYVCTGRHTMADLRLDGTDVALEKLGVQFIVDTCVVVTPILPLKAGVMMTNSAKFSHYSMGNTGYLPVFGSLIDCVKSAQAGRVILEFGPWK
ncbi:MAG: hypothetical protein CMM58_13035 [Rhodospirillaceae bacterium]|nr:hypothetical protein [Rhodospirillaceae bacterium]|tara:strand:- start:1737 stop:2990 length:1254 start_codon:yes stop_codon:yes gene_type:complete